MVRILLSAMVAFLMCSTANAKTLEQLLVEKGVITKADASSTTAGGAAKVYWNDGTRIEFPDSGFTTRITTYLKTAYTYTDAPKGEENVSSFDVRNARIVIDGTALHQEFNYKLEYDGALNRLLDGYIAWDHCGEGNYGIKMGQFKSVISRQYRNNSFKLMFPDASVASNYFSYGYRKGLNATAKMFDGQLVAGGTITNGNSDGEGPYSVNIDTKHILSADLRWNALGKMNALEESDYANTQDLALSFGAAYAYSPQNTALAEVEQELDVNRVSVDANLKYMGLGLNGEYYVSNEDPEYGDGWTTQGAYVQAGYFVMPQKLELAARWSYVACDDGKGLGLCEAVKNYDQATAGLNYYFYKYNLRAQLAYDYLRQKDILDDTTNTNRWILQVLGFF